MYLLLDITDEKIEGLKALINAIQQNVNNSINLIIACLGLCIAITGVALGIVVKQLVESKVNKKLSVIQEDIIKDIKKDMFDNPQFLWASGNTFVPKSNEVIISGLSNKGGMISLDFPTNLRVRTQKSYKELEIDVILGQKNGFIVNLRNFNREIDGNMIYWEIVWLNQDYR
jgi:hypothetical protein